MHFLLGGAVLFFLYGRVADPAEEARERIVVSETRIASLASTFERTWMRPPTRSELQHLVDDYVTEEVLYREALALGLDRDDLVIRRRLRQKMEFLGTDLADERVPDESELRAYLSANAERFARPPRVDLVQVFVDPGRPDPEERLAALQRELGSDPTAARLAELGDPTLLPPSLEAASPDQVAATFGRGFADALDGLPVGEWTGPIESSYGLHWVRIDGREPGRLPALEEIRPSVERDWMAEERTAAVERFYRTLREGYEVELRWPAEGGPESSAAVGAQGPGPAAPPFAAGAADGDGGLASRAR